MRFLKSALFGALAALFVASPVAARTVTKVFSTGDWVCDIRDCTNTAVDLSFNYGLYESDVKNHPLEDKQYWGPVRLINGMYPGPLIQVYEGERLKVILDNNLLLELPTSLHWHGMFQRGTDFMDGVAWITQCPIEQEESFTYEFYAEPAGSHWYHSHAGIEAIEGIAGALIVYRVNDPVNKFYNIGVDGTGFLNDNNPLDDLNAPRAEVIFAITQLWASTRIMHLLQGGVSVLNLNGKFQDGSARFPYQRFDVKSGICYRFRFMYLDAADNHGTAIKISIDNHAMKIFELDGIPNDPVDAKSLKLIYAQRTDAVVCPKPGKANHYINFEASDANNFFGNVNAPFKAILAVDGATDQDAFAAIDPTAYDGLVDHDFLYGSGYTLTYSKIPTNFPKQLLDHVGFEGVTSVPEPTHHLETTIGYATVENGGAAALGLTMWMSNGRKFQFPSTPLTISEKCAHPDTHSTFFPYDAVVDIVFNNGFNAIHPMHLHGGAFWVLGSSESVGEGGGADTMLTRTWRDAKCPFDELEIPDPAFAGSGWGCRFNPARHTAMLNTVNPPMRDTVGLPPHGWVAIRWRTNNPGYWFFHCHTEAHMGDGMLHVFNVAPEMRAPTPVDFPQCGKCATHDKYTTLTDSTPATLTEAGKIKFPAPTGNTYGATTNVYCENDQPAEYNGGNTAVNVNFQNLLNGFGAKTK